MRGACGSGVSFVLFWEAPADGRMHAVTLLRSKAWLILSQCHHATLCLETFSYSQGRRVTELQLAGWCLATGKVTSQLESAVHCGHPFSCFQVRVCIVRRCGKEGLNSEPKSSGMDRLREQTGQRLRRRAPGRSARVCGDRDYRDPFRGAGAPPGLGGLGGYGPLPVVGGASAESHASQC